MPGIPSSVTIKDAEMGMANVTWSEPEKPNGAIIGYDIRYKEVPGTVVSKKEVKSARQWAIVGGLSPASTYEFSVAARTKAGTGGFKKAKFDFTWCKFF